MKNIRLFPLFLAIPCLLPAGWRLFTRSFSEPVGLCSDLGLGLVLFAVVWFGPRWLRVLLLSIWALFQVMSMELLAAVGRLPSWQDVHYLLDPTFMENSSAGLHLAEPVFALLFLASVVPAVIVPVQRLGGKRLAAASALGLALVLQANISASHANQTIAARYNPLHWFVSDALFRPQSAALALDMTDMPQTFKNLDLQGESLLGAGRVKNVLIVVLEGLSGIYHPEIRRQMGVPDGPFQMLNLAKATEPAMLIPDFVTHSHQTIRGLYAIHCGDISKLSYDTPKGLELQINPERAGECLPAQLASQGWDTHFLQGAPLQFMNKDTVMPAMGFQQVHGLEWFTERKEQDFIWGTSDEDFFLGARRYVQKLARQDKPWLLSLLTVATHQPFDAPEDMIKKYGSRKIAAVARLDTAAAQFLDGLREDGILEDTLVIVTSDESHGYEGADWYGSWGYTAVMAPGQAGLPRLKAGTYGLMDIEASILDYLELPMPPSLIGRSFFREYSSGREMASYTSGKLRWQTEDNTLYECSVDGNCYVSDSAGILHPRRDQARRDEDNSAARLFGLASLLDHKLTVGIETQSLQFGHGEIRPLPEKIRNEWADNLVGAQYLDFPKNSRVDVDIRLKAVAAEESGLQLKLVLRQFEKEVTAIPFTPCPLLKTGEECHISFAFDNPVARKAFSFHLVGEGKNSSIQLQNFKVTINRGG